MLLFHSLYGSNGERSSAWRHIKWCRPSARSESETVSSLPEKEVKLGDILNGVVLLRTLNCVSSRFIFYKSENTTILGVSSGSRDLYFGTSEV